MFARLLEQINAPSDRPAIITPQGDTSWNSLRQLMGSLTQEYNSLARRRVGLALPGTAKGYGSLAALDSLKCDVFLFDAELPTSEILRRARGLRLGACVIFGPTTEDHGETYELPKEADWSGSGTVTILTSGSTGQPKAATHTWQSLLRPVRAQGNSESCTSRWLLTYRPDLYAGLQVALQCMAATGTLVVSEPSLGPAATIRLMQSTRVQAVPATPSFWRRLVLSAPDSFSHLAVRQITLGGEVVEQSLLDALRSLLPKARISHIYATTELGRCFAVHDGLAGFPASYLGRPNTDGVELREQEGELWVKSPNAMSGYDPHSAARAVFGEWVPTGDLIAVNNGRVHFKGRRSDVINVAGSKVHPLEVERIIRAIPGVADVHVFGKRSAVTGELVACQLVPLRNQRPDDLRRQVHRICMEQLSAPQRPRFISLVPQIEISRSGKTLRRGLALA